MSMKRKYKNSAFTELINSLKKNIAGGSSLDILIKIINENDTKYPELKNIFIHDMGSFMTHWFNMVNDSKKCSLKLQSKILSLQLISQYSDFNNLVLYCYNIIDQDKNEHNGNLLSQDILNYTYCIIKSIIQTTRRKIGLDTISKKYGI